MNDKVNKVRNISTAYLGVGKVRDIFLRKKPFLSTVSLWVSFTSN